MEIINFSLPLLFSLSYILLNIRLMQNYCKKTN